MEGIREMMEGKVEEVRRLEGKVEEVRRLEVKVEVLEEGVRRKLRRLRERPPQEREVSHRNKKYTLQKLLYVPFCTLLGIVVYVCV